jgi:transcriptional regulator NrdR family protein
VAEIEERMIRVRGLQFATGKISRTFYERWHKHGIQREQIEEAISQIEDDFLIEPTPKAIDEMLRSWKKGTGRGRVAL